MTRHNAATALVTDFPAPRAGAWSSSHSRAGAMPRSAEVVHLPVPRPPSLVEGYTKPGWTGIITIAPIADCQQPADEGAVDLVVTERQVGDLLRLRLPASPDADLAALLAEAELQLSSHTGRGDREQRQALWERGTTGTWRAAVSDLVLLAVEVASMPPAWGR